MTHFSLQKQLDLRSDRFGLKTACYLSEGTAGLSYDISERLRAARVQAVAKRKVGKAETASSVVRSGGAAALTWGFFEDSRWFARIGSVVPLIALVLGLLAINSVQSDNRAQELAEVDAALLTDDLPPAAFADPGFVQFLKTDR
jgi:Protein of unknown function (DUF3619)